MVEFFLSLDSYTSMYQLPVSTIEGEIKVPPHIRIHSSYVWCVKTAAIQGKLPLKLFSPPRIKAAGSSTSNILGDMPHSVTVMRTIRCCVCEYSGQDAHLPAVLTHTNISLNYWLTSSRYINNNLAIQQARSLFS